MQGQMPAPFLQGQAHPMQGQAIQQIGTAPSNSRMVPMTNAPIVIYATPPQKDYKKYKHKAALGLGITQVVCGIVAIILQILAIIFKSYYNNNYYYYDYNFVGTGIWTGVLFIIAGAFGIASSRRKNKCLIMTTMVMSIIAASMVGFLVGFSATSVALLADELGYDSDYDYDYDDERSKIKANLGANSILLVFAIVEVIVAILQSVFCCAVVCCGETPTSIPMTAQAINHPGQTITTASRATHPGPNGVAPYTPNEDTQGSGAPAYGENAPERNLLPGN